MQTENTFTYKQSELPAFRPEIKAEITAIYHQVSNLILRCQGNFLELEALAETLDDCADSCELNLNQIRIVLDNCNNNSQINDLNDLSEKSKTIVYSTGLAVSIATNLLCQVTGEESDVLAEMIFELVKNKVNQASQEEVDEVRIVD